MAKHEILIDKITITVDDEKNVAVLMLHAGERRFTLESFDMEANDLRPLTIAELGPKKDDTV